MSTITDRLSSALTGRYHIEREIGEGGMATVYLARDLRHERRVALKVLKPELGAVLGVERFLAEIKVTANLQHPNLLPLFDSGEADGLLFYVMPFVEGESLRMRLEREKQLPIDDAIRIATAVASALDYAHRHDVIHRDLKPENILLQAGQPVIADFGIALAVSNAGGNRITQTGLSLGTPQYMSPEQATGDRAVDGRTDIYSLGAVTYEMLTGEPPHIGNTSQAIIARLLTERPRSVRMSRPNVAVHMDAAVERALEKLPADRFNNAQEFADALSGKSVPMHSVLAGSQATAQGGAVAPATGGFRRLTAWQTAGGVLAGALLVAFGFATAQWLRADAPDNDAVLRLQYFLPDEQQANDLYPGTTVAFSPRGDRIAYLASFTSGGASSVWLRDLDQLESRRLTSTGSARTPAFSPDGKWIAFTDGFDVKKVSVDGGPIVTLATLSDAPFGLTWGTGSFLVAGSVGTGLFVIPERGGPARLLPKLNDEASNRWPLLLPDGKTIVYTSVTGGATVSGVLTLASLTDDMRTTLGVPGTSPLAFLNGQLIHATQEGALMAVAFDGARITNSTPVPLEQDVVVDANGGAKASISSSGDLVYRSGAQASLPIIVRGGTNPLTTEARNYLNPRFSPDGQRIAFGVATRVAQDVWVYDRARATLTKVTSEGLNLRPEWTPDGKRLLFMSDRSGQTAIWWQPADGSGPAELLYQPEEGDPFEAELSPDGRYLVYRTGPAGKPSRNVFAIQLEGNRKSFPLLTGKAFYLKPTLSPDGHWLAYESNESGNFEIYVRPFPGAGGRMQVSAGGGTEPVWAPSGRALYYRSGRDLVSVSITPGTALGVGERKIVFTGDYLTNPSHSNYDVSPDGTEFLMLRRAGDDVLNIVVHNWVRELVAKTAAYKQ